MKNEVRSIIPSPASIDYYGILELGEHKISTGDTVVFGFRMQAFVKRALIAAIRGIDTGTPYVEGIYNAEGKRSTWPH
jgi:predicted amino acid racemase